MVSNHKQFLIYNQTKHPYVLALRWLLVIAITLWLLNYLLKLLLNKVFFSEKFKGNDKYSFDEAKTYLTKKQMSGVLVNLLDHQDIIQSIKQNKKLCILDCSKPIETYLKESKDKTLIKLGFADKPDDLLKEVTYINELNHSKQRTILIFSKYSLSQLYKFYRQQAEDLENIKKDDEAANIRNMLVTFKSSMSHFVTLFIEQNQLKLSQKQKEKLHPALLEEIQVSDHLKKLKDILIDFQKQNRLISTDEYILKVKNLANSYYQYIWNSCTAEEKFILFDLAHDSVTNTRNRDELAALIGKRLINAENGLDLMNKSFANFILDHTNKNKLIYMEINAKRKGGWDKFRVPLLLIAGGIAVFIVVTQQELISNVYAIALSLGGLVGVFTKFSGVFGHNSPSE